MARRAGVGLRAVPAMGSPFGQLGMGLCRLCHVGEGLSAGAQGGNAAYICQTISAAFNFTRRLVLVKLLLPENIKRY